MIQYKRILYKISGEALVGNSHYGYNFDAMMKIANDIKNVCEQGIEVCLVVGGGNICRGVMISKLGMDRSVGDHMGMLATIMNGIALQDVIESVGLEVRVMSAIPIKQICEPYIRRRALRHCEKGRVIIFASGIGNPFFTTDTAAILRAVEMNCDCVFKGTSVDGVYSDDPKINSAATRYDDISYDLVLNKSLRFMDQAAIAMARDYKMPIIVFSIVGEDLPLSSILSGRLKYTMVSSG